MVLYMYITRWCCGYV